MTSSALAKALGAGGLPVWPQGDASAANSETPPDVVITGTAIANVQGRLDGLLSETAREGVPPTFSCVANTSVRAIAQDSGEILLVSTHKHSAVHRSPEECETAALRHTADAVAADLAHQLPSAWQRYLDQGTDVLLVLDHAGPAAHTQALKWLENLRHVRHVQEDSSSCGIAQIQVRMTRAGSSELATALDGQVIAGQTVEVVEVQPTSVRIAFR
jgi:hypothetical protein